jgi:diguanylate cyclase (GGDEF)-like protein
MRMEESGEKVSFQSEPQLIDASMSIRYSASQLRPDGDRTVKAPVISRDSLLVGLAEVFARHQSRHVLVADPSGDLIGIVSEDDLRNAMRDISETNPTAWHQRTVDSLLAVTFEDAQGEFSQCSGRTKKSASPHRTTTKSCDTTINEPVDFVSVSDGENLVALVSNEDVLYSWNRLEPALSNAATDPLTRLPNRAHFERRFHEEWHRASRLGFSLGLLIVDVDRFKEINDSFGHLRGDMALAAIADCCQRQLRSYDIVARYAGDEFVALTSGCQPEEIDLPIRRLQQAARELQLESNGKPIPVSLSIGAAVLSPCPGELKPDMLFDAADHCLYLAKKAGRDRAFRTQLSADGTTQDAIPVTAASTGTASRSPV